MSEFVLARADVKVLLWHMTAYGLSAILEDAGLCGVSLAWGGAPAQPVPILSADGLSADAVDDAVRTHATRYVTEPSWVLADVELRGSARGLMSPRLTPFDTPKIWRDVQDARHGQLDRLTETRSWLDLRMLAALGEPSYWSRSRQDVALQDDGASRLEMQPRNQGSELVGSRLRKLAHVLAARTTGTIATGLAGSTCVDEIGGGKPDSRTPTGLASPGPTDNAVAWCALWGISQFPLAQQSRGTARTTGHIGRSRSEWFYVPVWHGSWRPARLRSVLVSRQLGDAAKAGFSGRWAADETALSKAQAWLQARGVEGVVRFPIERFGSDSAPERRAMLGQPVRLGMS